MSDTADIKLDDTVKSPSSETEAATTTAAANVTASKTEKSEPVKLGYKNFTSGNEACAYFKSIMNSAPMDVNLNEYEAKALHDLLKNGHPHAAKKIGEGLAGFQVRRFNEAGALAFYVVRKDGSSEDFSYLKCCAALFTDVGSDSGRGKQHEGGRGKGRFGGRGRGGRGGGRGRGGRR
ncbi:hypothetical protein CEUSTIGMA_g10011.t1 [Chlamydomonas eustigma]|uniref:Uncharacterized protein n=1 Tax=Chlamydomonas eustigma TaxID=1157962 RepID=A0A250XHM7_9CHLO|nr:hypothetical protein CEUSTIGMA_g10011.t1 [Chlamydomonas eustigma]|eukprot:GAX82585.1 hypothetical protein CEUSTIGMA_g10011.t1 [Chlamydomonas eustigma]